METLSADEALLTKKFYPVIHCIDPFEHGGINHALQNTRIAMSNGADGVFLIGHKMHYANLTQVYDQVRKYFPEIWIGINFLDISSREDPLGLEIAARRCIDLDGLWTDALPGRRLDFGLGVEVFGGVAFKYIAPNLTGEALTKACEDAVGCIDVATTSGDATGSPPSVQKLVSIRMALKGRVPLAVASGVDEDNVSSLFPYVDTFLVSSSICEKKPLGNITITADYFIAKKVQTLADAIHKSED